jgi:DNA-binding transcriptional LysR family regulator
VPEAGRGLEGHDVLAFGDELRGTAGAKWLGENGSAGRVVFVSNSLVSHASAVTAGLGVSPLPCVFGDVEPSLRRVLPGIIDHHDIWLVVHPDVRTSARVRVVMEYLTKLVRREAALLGGRRGRPGGPRSTRR